MKLEKKRRLEAAGWKETVCLGGNVEGTGGSAQLVKWTRASQLINKAPVPNEIFNGPIYQK